MNDKKTDRELIEQMYGILFGNPKKQTGLIARLEAVEKAVKNNSKVVWLVLAFVIAAGLGVLFK